MQYDSRCCEFSLGLVVPFFLYRAYSSDGEPFRCLMAEYELFISNNVCQTSFLLQYCLVELNYLHLIQVCFVGTLNVTQMSLLLRVYVRDISKLCLCS